MDAEIQNVSDDLYLITLIPPLDGFVGFISAWLYQGDITYLVDVGPSSTAPGLINTLEELNIQHLDFILLTHIHLDHAGAIGELAERFPKTPIVCHPAGIPHLVDPTRLWEGTRKVLGATALGYGPIQAVSENRFLDAQHFTSETIVPILTPGHALHHVSYSIKPYLFAGEAAGVHFALSRDRVYMRPATPPKFFFDIALESVDKLIADKPDKLCYGHFGMANDAGDMLQHHRRQLFDWKTIIGEEITRSDAKDLVDACVKRLLKEDLRLASFHDLSGDIKEREKYFLRNSVKGFIGYLMAE